MTDARTQKMSEELVSLRRENLALRLANEQLRDVAAQRDHQRDELWQMLADAVAGWRCVAPRTPLLDDMQALVRRLRGEVTPGVRSASQGDGGPLWEIANAGETLTHGPGIVEITHSYPAPSLENQRKAIAELMEIYSTERTLPIVGYADFD